MDSEDTRLVEDLRKDARELRVAVERSKELHRILEARLHTDEAAQAMEIQTIYESHLRSAERRRCSELDSEQRRFQDTEGTLSERAADLKRDIDARRASLRDASRNIERDLGILAAEFGADCWRTWEPVSELVTPSAVRFGTLSAKGDVLEVVVPALLPFADGRGVLLKPMIDDLPACVGAVQAMLLRLLAAFPPGKIRFTFFDPVERGDNVAPFLYLKDYDEELMGQMAWTESHDLELRLRDMTARIDTVKQKYLRTDHQDLAAYNRANPSVPEPYHVLVVFDFPIGFTESSATRLTSIARSGPSCGIYPVVLSNLGVEPPHGFSMEALSRSVNVLDGRSGDLLWYTGALSHATLRLDLPPPKALAKRVVEAVGEIAKSAPDLRIPFSEVSGDGKMWSGRSGDGVSAGLGRFGVNGIQKIEFDDYFVHALVAGKTGMGKSNLLHVAIINLARKYSPDELQFYMVDFKQVEFRPYGDLKLPHARVIAIQSDREFGLSVLEALMREHDRRKTLLGGLRLSNIREYRRQSDEVLPRLILFMDEFQILFQEHDQITNRALLVLDTLVCQGRSQGIHVILSTQTLATAVGHGLPAATLGQIGTRIAFRCDERASQLILGDGNDAARNLTRKGEACFNASEGRPEGNNTFQVAYMSPDERNNWIARFREEADVRFGEWPKPIVFSGSSLADVSSNAAFASWQAAYPQASPPKEPLALVGEPVTLEESTGAIVTRTHGANLLVAGQFNGYASNILTVAAAGLALQLPGAVFSILILSGDDEEAVAPLRELAPLLQAGAEAGSRRDLQDVVLNLAGEVDRRFELDGRELRGEPERFLVLFGLPNTGDLRSRSRGSEFDITDTTGQDGARDLRDSLLRVLAEGPALGIHTLAWAPTPKLAERVLGYDAMQAFSERVAFQMFGPEGQSFVESSSTETLGSFRALRSSSNKGQLERFRPFQQPNAAWIQRVGEVLGGAR